MITARTVGELVAILTECNQQAQIDIEVPIHGTDYTENREVEVSVLPPDFVILVAGRRIK